MKITKTMKSIKDNEALSKEERLHQVKLAKGGSWYDGWKPYCLNCSSNSRMEETTYGFKCSSCKNIIGWDLIRLKESPLNMKPTYNLDR
jgi:hypothetical protein